MIKTCYNYCTYTAGVISGYSGVIPIANCLFQDNDSSLLNYSLDALNNYLVQKGKQTLVPGNYGYKISLDFESGNIGLLLMLNQIINNSDEFSWLPF